jgi:hypothetical protein
VGTQALAVPQHIEPDRNGAEGLKKSARADRIANALVEPILERDVIVVHHALQAGDLDAVDHVVGRRQHLRPVDRGDHFPGVRSELGEQPADQTCGHCQSPGINVDQGEGPPAIARNSDDIVDQTRGKEAPGSEESELDRPVH